MTKATISSKQVFHPPLDRLRANGKSCVNSITPVRKGSFGR